MAQFKARKRLEAYNQLVCGWIKDVNTRKTAGKQYIGSQHFIFGREPIFNAMRKSSRQKGQLGIYGATIMLVFSD